MGLCCERCFDEQWICGHIKAEGRRGDCNYCGARKVIVADTRVVGTFVRAGLERAYETVDAAGVYYDSETGSYAAGQDAVSTLLFEEGIVSEAVLDAGKERELIETLLDDSGPDLRAIQQGDADWLEGGAALLVLKDAYHGPDFNQYQGAWERFKETIKFHSRFFDQKTGAQRDALLKPLEPFFEAMTSVLEPGGEFFRARRADSRLPNAAWQRQQALGPPPVSRATHSRMSPPGISYLYLSDDAETAVAEIRPNVGWELWVAQFVLEKPVKVFDCTKVPEIKIQRIFDPEYDHERRWAGDFFDRFTDDISQPPTSKDDLLEYVPTQVFAEYLRARGFDGLRFRSAQNGRGKNVTLFCSPEDDVAHGYLATRPLFHEWVRLQIVSNVTVTRAAYEIATVDSRAVTDDDLKDSRTEDDNDF